MLIVELGLAQQRHIPDSTYHTLNELASNLDQATKLIKSHQEKNVVLKFIFSSSSMEAFEGVNEGIAQCASDLQLNVLSDFRQRQMEDAEDQGAALVTAESDDEQQTMQRPSNHICAALNEVSQNKKCCYRKWVNW